MPLVPRKRLPQGARVRQRQSTPTQRTRVRGQPSRQSRAQTRAEYFRGIHEIVKEAPKWARHAMTWAEGFDPNLATRPSARALQVRQATLDFQTQKALRRLGIFYREKRGKMPPDIRTRNGKTLFEIKETILEHVFEPQGEIKSFDDMRAFLRENGVCLNEGEFNRVFNDLFNKGEEKIFSQVFQQRNRVQNPLGLNETRFPWYRQEKKAA